MRLVRVSRPVYARVRLGRNRRGRPSDVRAIANEPTAPITRALPRNLQVKQAGTDHTLLASFRQNRDDEIDQDFLSHSQREYYFSRARPTAGQSEDATGAEKVHLEYRNGTAVAGKCKQTADTERGNAMSYHIPRSLLCVLNKLTVVLAS